MGRRICRWKIYRLEKSDERKGIKRMEENSKGLCKMVGHKENWRKVVRGNKEKEEGYCVGQMAV